MATGTAAPVVLHGTAMGPFAPWFLTSVRTYWAPTMCQALPPAPETQAKWNRCCFCTWKTVNLVGLPSCHPIVIIYWLSTFSVPGKHFTFHSFIPMAKAEVGDWWFPFDRWENQGMERMSNLSKVSWPVNGIGWLQTLLTLQVYTRIPLLHFPWPQSWKISAKQRWERFLGLAPGYSVPTGNPGVWGLRNPSGAERPNKERKITVPKQQRGLAWWKIITWAIMYISTSRKY